MDEEWLVLLGQRVFQLLCGVQDVPFQPSDALCRRYVEWRNGESSRRDFEDVALRLSRCTDPVPKFWKFWIVTQAENVADFISAVWSEWFRRIAFRWSAHFPSASRFSSAYE